MKEKLLFLFLVALALSGCSRTFYAVQQDSADIWEGTKGAIHNITAPN